ncbi:MAG: RsmB/NOP family class I SAM-dependent RNA methyltransferase [Nanoarchaeota archaeon]|nr:RsmB/NOP family class I SAM-dependent RNA methyltransferase [Nanoarchaeota archaeon]MBU1029981.1 RsmB/NOP family class I SAM-dependent RNA methyltransferase [Nanoarchaeota archaeon]MBU1849248.1 RsmB/NOP family class I SAM-dependent RNA methyltransferase [Nanoarchaeota archaeon]
MSFFLRRYEELGEKFSPDNISLKKSLRVNTLKISTEKLISRLKKNKIKLEKIPFLDDGFFYEADFSLGATPEYLLGYYYLQEVASQLSVQVLHPESHELVLDMSAAPGGKTTQIAGFMKNKGLVVALDNNTLRLNSLRNNLERLGVKNVVIFKKDSRFVSDLGLKFDKILLDAPCSGNFVDNNNWLCSRTIEDINSRAMLQKELLKSAVKVLKPGGVLVYSTCSLEPEENELNISWLLKNHPNLRLVETGLSVGDEGVVNVFGEQLSSEIKNCRRFWPHKIATQGFFIAKIELRNT